VGHEGKNSKEKKWTDQREKPENVRGFCVGVEEDVLTLEGRIG